MGDAGTVDEVLARQAGDIGAGTAHIALFYDHDTLAGTAQMPRYRFACLPAAEHHSIISINCGHGQFLLCRSRAARPAGSAFHQAELARSNRPPMRESATRLPGSGGSVSGPR